mmetsp:Transcript_11693/g.18885  ORF Transcript_11693/g.18885 Transcript_11693/m.18885 type:complete len:119 (-) Transcript_11693:553-909(-)
MTAKINKVYKKRTRRIKQNKETHKLEAEQKGKQMFIDTEITQRGEKKGCFIVVYIQMNINQHMAFRRRHDAQKRRVPHTTLFWRIYSMKHIRDKMQCRKSQKNKKFKKGKGSACPWMK